MTSVFGALYERAWTSWARRRYRAAFDQVSTFCLFVGYPRSGHSLLGAMLNAHRHAVIAHELEAPQLVLAGCDRETLYARILARAAWFDLRGNTSNYAYQIPNQWQGRFERLRVVGDKRGGGAALAIGEHPQLLDRLRAMVGVPLRLIHVVRNPFDNIAAISLWHRLSIEEAVEYYFRLCRITAPLAAPDRDDALTVHHEELVRAPEATLSRVCGFLGLESDAEYLTACGAITAETPSHTRLRVPWSSAQIDDVRRRAAPLSFLSGYTFEIADGEPHPPRDGPRSTLWPRIVLRWFPTETQPPPLAASSAPCAAAGENGRPDALYWSETVRQAQRAGPMRAWYEYMRGVYGGLIREWLAPANGGIQLKTDLFEEAVSASHPLADLGARSIGLDLSFDVARGARERLSASPGRNCLVADLRAIPLRDGSMNGILSGSSLDHFQARADVEAGLAEIARVLTPGGSLVLTLDNPHNPVIWARNHLPFQLLRACGLVPYYVGVTLGRRETIRALDAVGLRTIETGAVAHAPRAPSIWVVRLAERFGWQVAWLPGALGACERLSEWPTRYLTGYYLAFRIVKDPVEPKPAP